MDLITQGLLGAVAGQACLHEKLGRKAALIGGMAGLFADLDVLLTPLAPDSMPWLYHRHFTHALIFIPIGALLVFALFQLWPSCSKDGKWKWTLLCAFLGYLTHAPLDLLTSLGTRILWPFESYAYALDFIADQDPIFSLLLLIPLVITLIWNKAMAVRAGLILAACYLGLGVYQNHRVNEVQQELAHQRGHQIVYGRVKCTLWNNMLWKSYYIANDGRIYGDAVRVPLWSSPQTMSYGSIRRLLPEDLIYNSKEIDEAHQQFHEFAEGFTAVSPEAPSLYADMRYTLGMSFDPLWGQEMDPKSERVGQWVRRHPNRWDVPLNQLKVAWLGSDEYKAINTESAPTPPPPAHH